MTDDFEANPDTDTKLEAADPAAEATTAPGEPDFSDFEIVEPTADAAPTPDESDESMELGDLIAATADLPDFLDEDGNTAAPAAEAAPAEEPTADAAPEAPTAVAEDEPAIEQLTPAEPASEPAAEAEVTAAMADPEPEPEMPEPEMTAEPEAQAQPADAAADEQPPEQPEEPPTQQASDEPVAEPAAPTAQPIEAADEDPAQGEEFAMTNASVDRVQDFLGELKTALVDMAQRPQSAVDVSPLVAAVQQGFDRSAEQAQQTSTALTSLTEHMTQFGQTIEGGVTKTLDTAMKQPPMPQVAMVPQVSGAPGAASIISDRATRQVVVLGTVSLIVLGWSILFWIKTGSPRLALGTLIGANLVACFMLLTRRDRS